MSRPYKKVRRINAKDGCIKKLEARYDNSGALINATAYSFDHVM